MEYEPDSRRLQRRWGFCGAVAEWSKALAWKVSIRQKRIEGSNPSRSAIILLFHIRFESEKPSFSAAFSVLRIHVHPCQSTGDRLEMWEIWWHGKTFRNRCESSNMTWAA